jgi:hypothetical protein
VWPIPLSVPNPDPLANAIGDARADPVDIAPSLWGTISGADIGDVRPLRDFQSDGFTPEVLRCTRTSLGPGFRRRLLADLQHLARRSLLYIERSLHLFLQSAVPLQETSLETVSRSLTSSAIEVSTSRRIVLRNCTALRAC